MSYCGVCGGTGKNRHSGYLCDACHGTGERLYLTGMVPVVAIILWTAAMLYVGYWIYILVHHV